MSLPLTVYSAHLFKDVAQIWYKVAESCQFWDSESVWMYDDTAYLASSSLLDTTLFPKARVITRGFQDPDKVGQIYNLARDEVQAPYVFQNDSDMFLVDADALRRAVDALEADKRLAAYAFVGRQRGVAQSHRVGVYAVVYRVEAYRSVEHGLKYLRKKDAPDWLREQFRYHPEYPGCLNRDHGDFIQDALERDGWSFFLEKDGESRMSSFHQTSVVRMMIYGKHGCGLQPYLDAVASDDPWPYLRSPMVPGLCADWILSSVYAELFGTESSESAGVTEELLDEMLSRCSEEKRVRFQKEKLFYAAQGNRLCEVLQLPLRFSSSSMSTDVQQIS